MPLDPHAGRLPGPERLIDVPALIAAYYTLTPNPDRPAEKISFGTSGHRGSSLNAGFNEAHILAVTQDRKSVV